MMITQTIYPNGICRKHSDILSARRTALEYVTLSGTRSAIAIRSAKDYDILGWIAYNHHNRYSLKHPVNKLFWITHKDGRVYYQHVNPDGSLRDFPQLSF